MEGSRELSPKPKMEAHTETLVDSSRCLLCWELVIFVNVTKEGLQGVKETRADA